MTARGVRCRPAIVRLVVMQDVALAGRAAPPFAGP